MQLFAFIRDIYGFGLQTELYLLLLSFSSSPFPAPTDDGLF